MTKKEWDKFMSGFAGFASSEYEMDVEVKKQTKKQIEGNLVDEDGTKSEFILTLEGTWQGIKLFQIQDDMGRASLVSTPRAAFAFLYA